MLAAREKESNIKVRPNDYEQTLVHKWRYDMIMAPKGRDVSSHPVQPESETKMRVCKQRSSKRDLFPDRFHLKEILKFLRNGFSHAHKRGLWNADKELGCNASTALSTAGEQKLVWAPQSPRAEEMEHSMLLSACLG